MTAGASWRLELLAYVIFAAALSSVSDAATNKTLRRGFPRNPYILRASALGVQDFHIPGVIDLSYKGREAVVLHVYLKSLATAQTVRWRGFVFAESIEREYYNYGQTELSQPPLMRDWKLHMYLRCAPAAWLSWPLNVSEEMRRTACLP